MTDLEHSRVFRGGITAPKRKRESTSIRTHITPDAVNIIFYLDSKGGGVTDVLLEIDVDDWPRILAGMLEANRKQALQFMCAALFNQIFPDE